MTDQPYYGYVENPVLDNLELSVRADRVLRDYGRIKTLDDFMALNKAQVMALKGAGMRTWGEIKTLQKNLKRAPWPEPVDLTVDGVYEEIRFTLKPDISLRDQAALAALQGSLARVFWPACQDDVWRADIARHAYRIADAFIAAREGKTNE